MRLDELGQVVHVLRSVDHDLLVSRDRAVDTFKRVTEILFPVHEIRDDLEKEKTEEEESKIFVFHL